MHDAVRPQDDLFGHVNGIWFDTAEIPADLPAIGGFTDLFLESEATVGEILREASAAAESGGAPPGSERRKLGDLFASFMDEDRLETLGSEPLADDLAAIAALIDPLELAELLGRLQRHNVGGVVDCYVHIDDRDSERNIVNLVQGGLGLPDEAFYREDAFAEHRIKYVVHVAAMLRLLGYADAEADDAAARLMALETRLAAAHWDRVRSRDVVATYNLTTLEELRTAAPALDWPRWIAGLGGSGEQFAEVLVRQPSYFPALSAALTEVPLEDWKVWLTFHLVSTAAPYLSSAFVNEHFDFYFRTLTGARDLRDRWKRGVALCNTAIGEAVGAEYVARVLPPEAKTEMDELVANLLEAYRVSIGRLDWMSAETRDRALEKLSQFRSKIGHPTQWRDYSALEIDRTNLLGNVRCAAAFEVDRQLRKIGEPVDRDEWLITPQTVNAYYLPGANEICFPAAILRPPFYQSGADPTLNYGGIGAVIGHEIGHGFDDQGSRYDGNGNLENWWTDEDRARFQERADRLITQYDAFEPRTMPGQHVNGALTVGENIGDLGGLTIALLAYEISLAGDKAPIVNGFTGAQRVIQNWALIWRIKTRPELALQRLSVDPHAPPEFRANVVRNLDEFHAAYATAPGDGLWLDPKDRVRIW